MQTGERQRHTGTETGEDRDTETGVFWSHHQKDWARKGGVVIIGRLQKTHYLRMTKDTDIDWQASTGSTSSEASWLDEL